MFSSDLFAGSTTSVNGANNMMLALQVALENQLLLLNAGRSLYA